MTSAFLSQGLRPQEGLTGWWPHCEVAYWRAECQTEPFIYSFTHTEGIEQTGPRAGSVRGLGKLYKTWLLSARTQSLSDS